MGNTRPPLDVLGRDLLVLPRWRVALSLASPFALFGVFIVAAATEHWFLAAVSVAILSFVTYGSVSHDLVHRSLGLPRGLNDALLSVIEMLLFRSGRAYRLAHLNHHARYPNPDEDPESAAAHGSLVSALASGWQFFPRLWWWAYRRYPSHRRRLAFEGALILALAASAIGVAIAGITNVLLLYLLLAYAGTWIVPLATAYIPHRPSGDGELFQTKRFRGLALRCFAFEHLYHLEHHLYPAVPHHHWPELSRRLDPILDAAGVPIVRLIPKSSPDAAA